MWAVEKQFGSIKEMVCVHRLLRGKTNDNFWSIMGYVTNNSRKLLIVLKKKNKITFLFI